MPRYVAFLRAINVGARRMKMDALRDLFVALGLDDAETFIASGNVIFSSRKSAKTLEPAIEKHLLSALGFEVVTFVRTIEEIEAVADGGPLASVASDETTTHVGFLRNAPEPETCQKLADMSGEADRLVVEGRELFWLVRGKLMDSKLTGAKIEKVVGPTTFRNVTMLRRLVAKCSSA